MAVTRRQFITTLGTMAAAVGIGQADLAKVTEAFAIGGLWDGTHGVGTKPKVIWVHGAECTGCSTSLLSFFEDATGVAVEGTGITTALALGIINSGKAAASVTVADVPRTLETVFTDGNGLAANIADVLIDFIDLQYHETIMVSGGDGAYGFLASEMASNSATPFVMVVEGAIQPSDKTGYWNASGDVPWCSIGVAGGDAKGNAVTVGGSPMAELAFPDVVKYLAMRSACAAIVAIGQCATFGGYPACLGPGLDMPASGNAGKSMTGALGTAAFLAKYADPVGSPGLYSGKVINSPGCPTNPWWFCLTVVAWLVDAVSITAGHGSVLSVLNGATTTDLSINPGAVDSEGRLTAVYSNQLHSPYCPRYPKYAAGIFASAPGDDGCLLNLGCKAQWTMSTCGRHGWNNAQPHNATTIQAPFTIDNAGVVHGTVAEIPPLYTNHNFSNGTDLKIGGCCLTAGAPCMGCTEKGYPDAMTPFVVR